MDSPLFFKAPWSTTLTTITFATCVLMGGITLYLVWMATREKLFFLFLTALIPLLIVLVTSLYSVRGYTVTNNVLQVSRLGWSTAIPLTTLETAVYDPTAMDHSLRLMGNGGLFAFTGRFRNKKLGNYQAYGTNPRLSVVLTFPTQKIVVTPQRPEQFVALLNQATQGQL